jgi:glycosyltransferase involved in cell wall biosynthesis
MRVAIVHDWLTGMRGGEKCLEVFCEIFPDADLFTLLHVPGSVSKIIESRAIQTSPIQHMPRAGKNYRYYLPLMPAAVRMLDLSGYDFILSSSHCVAKGARGGEGAYHVCYCYTPMRYAWSAYDEYFGRARGAAGWLLPRVMDYLRGWDREAGEGVDEFVAISRTVAERIRNFYGREADVLYPPVDTERYRPRGEAGDYYLMVSAFAPYKRVDVAVEAFNRLGRPLKIVGQGQDFERIRNAGKSNIEFLGWQGDAALAELYAGCQAFIFPGLEDFGITPLEAQACGRPVIALGAGGALETVLAVNRAEYAPPPGLVSWDDGPGDSGGGPTGLFFERPEPDLLAEAVERFEGMEEVFRPEAARRQAERFSRDRFKEAARKRFLSGWEAHTARQSARPAARPHR